MFREKNYVKLYFENNSVVLVIFKTEAKNGFCSYSILFLFYVLMIKLDITLSNGKIYNDQY